MKNYSFCRSMLDSSLGKVKSYNKESYEGMAQDYGPRK